MQNPSRPNLSRRAFIKRSALTLALSAPLSHAGAIVRRRPLPKVGVQLYSVRKRCAEDLQGTLKAIREMGYVGVEFAGYYGKSAGELKQLLHDHGLAACGTHTKLDTIRPENLTQTIEFNQELGNPYLMVPGMQAKDAAGWIKLADLFSEAAAQAGRHGMYVGYHNHQHEFKDKFDNICKWEIFFSHASQEVCQQLDVGHVVSAGEDPVYWLRKFPRRSRTLHAKEIYPGPGILGQVPAGQQGVKWDEVFNATDRDVTEWYIVESEADPASLDNIGGCINFLKSKGRA